MSDSEGDFSDELLELAGATEKKRKSKSSKSSSSKRRKADVSLESDSENEPESEEDDSNPYPLEGKYVDEADRQKLLQLSDFERENVLAQRLEEMQRIQDKRNLDQMIKAQRGDSDNVSKAAKRAHAVRGATKEKSRKLDELKARRKAKDEKKKVRANSPKRDRSSSPMDMEMSSEDEEDGQISKLEQQEEREQRLINKAHPDEETTTLEDLESCRVSRDQLSKYCLKPWFEDYVKGAWVRYLIGNENGEPVYRICEISNLGANLVKPYKVNDQVVNQQLELKHGKSVKLFHMDIVSNSKFPQKEFERLVKVFESEKMKLPSKRALEKKSAQLAKLSSQLLTESDVTVILARKNMLSSSRASTAAATMEKSRLVQERTLALRRQDSAEVAMLDLKIAELVASVPLDGRTGMELEDTLAKVNERNRKANLEAVRKAEALEAERKRRERKLAAAGRSSTPVDPSARLKTLPRVFENNSRMGTPLGTPKLEPSTIDLPRSVSPFPPSAFPPSASSASKNPQKSVFESAMVSSIEVDLGDF